ncbi:trehalose-phosphatase [Verruconis gallopava]|uniref:Trehalose-phosphatase n=1 Tax=Verruconis gallopava TaxID=253628 RepID=A0A0D2ARG6_9PEZI|nr:trehalose-phosphatase [Verruconis gallopava]KIW01789.1 trehalose-phosphatase [Verruconis gallopava]
MSTFIVSLFLPYTVDFNELPTPARRPSPPPRQPSKTSLEESVGAVKLPGHDRRASLELRGSLFPAETPPRTPAATADAQEFFSQIDQPTPATHFVQPHNPRTLVRSDSHMPEWGRHFLFNQPSAKPQQMPPARILGYGPSPSSEGEREQDRARKMAKTPKTTRNKSHRRHHSRSASTEVKWSTEWNIVPALQGNGGLANAVRASADSGAIQNIIWLGTVGFPTDSLPQNTRNEIDDKLTTEYDAIPVYISDADFDGHYSHFCKTILWPVFHYQIPDHPKSKAYEDHSYKYYVKLNEAFADSIVSNYKNGDVIWIHDYHLLLVPRMVRQKLPDAKIGFFLHTAFPSSEVFRCLAQRNALLEGMLGANLIGFQCPEYLEHFLTTTSRLLRVPVTPEGVDVEDHFVNVTHLPIGIDPKALDKARHEPEVQQWIRVMEQRYKDKLIIVARDRLDQVHGVRQKLLSFELFLNKNPDWVEKVVLIQVATSATDQEELASTVSDIVTRIDATFSSLGHQPLVFLRQDIGFPQYLALLSVADVLMITSLREGMSLTGHEYILCQDGAMSNKKHGPMVLSEFTGAASVFDNADLTINPWDYKQTAIALKKALEMTPEEMARRYERIREVVMNQTGEAWMTELNKRLDKAFDDRNLRDTKSTPRLIPATLLQKYQRARKRLFIMDYEGTLASFSKSEGHVHFNSPQRVLDTLNDLISAGNNIVYVMSARMPEELDKIFARVPGLGLIAENGCFIRPHGSDAWRAFVDMDQMKQWKKDVKQIMKYYQERMDGGVIEEKHCSLFFRYDKVKEQDQESAARLAGDCANHINDACGGLRIHAVPLQKAILIEPRDYGKGYAAKQIFNENWGPDTEGGALKNAPEFLLVAGDDREDEQVFRWANNLAKEWPEIDVTTVSLGKKNTEAMVTLTQGSTALISVLQRLSGITRR